MEDEDNHQDRDVHQGHEAPVGDGILRRGENGGGDEIRNAECEEETRVQCRTGQRQRH